MSVPGTFIIVDHSIERAFNRGALAQLKAAGEEDIRCDPCRCSLALPGTASEWNAIVAARSVV